MTILTESRDYGATSAAATNRSPNRACFAPPRSASEQTSSFPILLDTIRLRGPVSDWMLPFFREKGSVDLDTGEVVTQTTSEYGQLLPGLWLTVQKDKVGGHYATMEFSVPRYRHGHNISGSTLSEVETAVRDLYLLGRRYVIWAVEPLALQVMRLDLVRDFTDVLDFDLLVDGLAPLTPPRVPHNESYHTRGRPTGLRRGARGRWAGTLYHKGRQQSALARVETDPTRRERLNEQATLAENRCRYELQLRKPVLNTRGLSNLADVLQGDSELAFLVQHYFRRCYYDREVGGISKIQAAVRRMRSNPEDHKKAGKMLGLLLLCALDEAHDIKDPRTLRDLWALADKYGLNPSDLVANADRPAISLDLASGMQTRRLDR